MPRVPAYDSFQIAQNALPAAEVAAPTVTDFASRQVQQFSQAAASASNAADRIAADMAAKADATRIDDFTNQAVKARNDLGAEAQQLQGSNALHRPEGQSLPDEYSKKLNEQLTALQAGLGNAEQRQAAAHISAQIQQQFYGTLTNHMVQQQKVYQEETYRIGLDTAGEQAGQSGGDEIMFQQSLDAMRGMLSRQAQANGTPAGWVDAQLPKLKDAAYLSRYKAWEQTNPLAALENFQQSQSQIGPLMRDRLAGELFQSSAPLLAQIAKPWVMGSGSAPANAPGQAGTPRGIRNNNPGNIMKGGDNWEGEAAGNDPRYVSFATPEAGIRAMGKTLLTYQDKHGRDTVEGIVSRWAPATENDTNSYIGAVSKALGVKADDKLNLRDPAVMSRLVGAMIGVENGKQPYSDAQIATGVNAALGKAALPASANPTGPAQEPAWRDPNALTGIAILDNLPPDQRAQVYAMAHSQVRQDMGQARDRLTSRVNDAQAEYMATGKAANPPSEAEFIQAYGQMDGVSRYAAFQDVATLGQKVQQTRTLSNADLVAMVNNAKPSPGDGFAERQRNYEILQRAVSQTLDERRKDPVKFALQNPAFGIQPFTDFGNTNALLTEVGKRKGAMNKIASDYGTAPALMTNEEAAAFGTFLGTQQTPDKARILGNLAAIGGVAGVQSLSAQLKDKDNTLAVAAMLAAYTTDPTTHWFGPDTPGTNVGQMYLDGKDAIEQKRAKIDAQAEFGTKAQIYSALEGVYQTPQERDTAAEAAYGIYGKLQADGSGDVERAVTLATGGVMQFNGGKIAKPYGWDDGKFTDAITDTLPKVIKAAGGDFIAGGKKVSAADFAKALPGARLQTAKNMGTYMVMKGNEPVRNLDGTPYILKVAP